MSVDAVASRSSLQSLAGDADPDVRAAPAPSEPAAAAASSGHLSPRGLAMLKDFEGLRTTAYRDAAGVWTIGYGHTGADVKPGLRISEAQATALLAKDVAWAEAAVRQAVKVPVTQNQFDALVSFTYNLGAGGLRRSSLLARLNAGDVEGAAASFSRYVHAGGRMLEGLQRRRAAEADLFRSASEAGRPAQVPWQPSGSPGGGQHVVVKRGDCLSSIAARAGVSLQALLADPANAGFRANPDLIFAGQVVHLPGKACLDAVRGNGSDAMSWAARLEPFGLSEARWSSGYA